MSTFPYSAEFFDAFSDGSSRSAARVLPIALQIVHPASAVDVGCGVGTWAAELRGHGIADVIGVDGAYVDPDRLLIPREAFLARDLRAPLGLGRMFDLAVCLEVAEHLPTESAAHLVSELTELAPAVLFSAAIPFQGGNHHVNEQWPSYWASLFARHGYRPYDVVRPRVWTWPEVDFWYAQNTILYVHRDRPLDAQLAPADPACSMFDVVHPRLYDAQHEHGHRHEAAAGRHQAARPRIRRALGLIARRGR